MSVHICITAPTVSQVLKNMCGRDRCSGGKLVGRPQIFLNGFCLFLNSVKFKERGHWEVFIPLWRTHVSAVWHLPWSAERGWPPANSCCSHTTTTLPCMVSSQGSPKAKASPRGTGKACAKLKTGNTVWSEVGGSVIRGKGGGREGGWEVGVALPICDFPHSGSDRVSSGWHNLGRDRLPGGPGEPL